jgi:hypothetical protein
MVSRATPLMSADWKLGRVNVRTSHIATILESFMFVPVPQSVPVAFRNGKVSLGMNID